MRRFVPRLAILFIALSVSAAPRGAGASADPAFDAYWHDGKAELDGYRLRVERYGQVHAGQGVMIYVTEPFRASLSVKADDPSKNPQDSFDAFKLNLVRDFQTGIYDYNTMVSLFVRSRDFSPVKIAFSSAEWCGQVYEELLVSENTLRRDLHSYFEGESARDSLARPQGEIEEDELYVRLRGLRGEFLRPGEKRDLPFLASPFYRRLAHRRFEWSTAEIERRPRPDTARVPAGEFLVDVYTIRTGDGRVGRIEVEENYPHRIVRWSWKPERPPGPGFSLGGTDSAELSGSARLEYWKLHDNGDESYLKKLGLEPTVK